MQKIKTEQPYKLYKKILKNRSTAKFAVLGIAVIIFVFLGLIVFVIESVENGLDLEMLLALLFFMLVMPLIFYNPRLKAEYEPEVSYAYFRNYKKLTKKLPKTLLYKEDQMRIENHQDVDFNVNVDLNAIYGVNDKLVMSYQNFDYEKQKMENGDYLLGVSTQGVYYVHKNKTVTKTKISFGDICTLGMLVCPGNIFVFHIISKLNDEISIIVDQDDSLMVSPYMMFSALLKLLDDYILNDGVVANSSSKRRVVVSSGVGTSSGSTSAPTQDATNNNRVIDLSYSTGVLEEMRTATFVGSNRQIEVDEHVTSKVVNETPYTPVVNRPSNETVSNRNIDLDDLIESHITDAHRDYNETKTPLVQPVQVSQARTEIPQDETPKVENLEIETSKSSTPVIETPAVETSRNKTSQVDVSEIGTTKPEQPKEKGKTGLIIGIVAGVLVIAAGIAVFVMKSNKEQALFEQQAEYELQMLEQQAQYEAELEEQRQQQEAQQNKLKGYEWLEGVWAGTDEYGSFGRVIVTDSYFQVVNSNMDDALDNVEDMPKQDYELKTWQNAYDGYDDDGEVFGFSDFIGVDAEKRCIYIIQGEYSALTLHKINASSFESAVYEANHNYPAENDQDMSNESYQQNDSNGSRFVVIDGSQLRLRLGPSTSSETFKWTDGTNRHPNVGEKFKYLGEKGDFFKIDFNGNVVWVSKQYTHLE